MPTYKVTDPTSGKSMRLTGDAPPSEQELNDIFAKVNGTPAATSDKVKMIPRSSWAQKAAGVVAPALPIAGMLAGEAIGGGAGLAAGGIGAIPGAVAGTALGYAGGRQLENVLQKYAQGQKPPTLGEQARATTTDIPVGLGMGMAGPIIGKAAEGGMKAAGKWAPRIYNAVAKFAKPQDVKTAIANRIPITEKGMAKAEGIFDKLNSEISSIINTSKKSVKTADVLKSLNRVREEVKGAYANAKPILDEIDAYEKDFIAGRGKEIPVAAAQKLKQGIQKRMAKYYRDPSSVIQPKNMSPGVYIEAEKAAGHGLREELVQLFPELSSLNKDDAAIISLLKAMPNALGRIERRDVAQLPELIASGAGAAAAGPVGLLAGVGMKLLRFPGVMSRLAFALDKAAKIGGAPTLSRAASYGALRGAQPQVPDLATPAAAEELPTAGKPGLEGMNARARGIEFYTANNWDDAIREWRTALKEEPGKAKEIIGFINRALLVKRKAKELEERQKNQIRDSENEMRKYMRPGPRYASQF